MFIGRFWTHIFLWILIKIFFKYFKLDETHPCSTIWPVLLLYLCMEFNVGIVTGLGTDDSHLSPHLQPRYSKDRPGGGGGGHTRKGYFFYTEHLPIRTTYSCVTVFIGCCCSIITVFPGHHSLPSIETTCSLSPGMLEWCLYCSSTVGLVARNKGAHPLANWASPVSSATLNCSTACYL